MCACSDVTYIVGLVELDHLILDSLLALLSTRSTYWECSGIWLEIIK